MKQTFQIQHNMVKNPSWQDTDQLAICKHGERVELRATEKQLQLEVRAGLEPRKSRNINYKIINVVHLLSYNLMFNSQNGFQG